MTAYFPGKPLPRLSAPERGTASGRVEQGLARLAGLLDRTGSEERNAVDPPAEENLNPCSDERRALPRRDGNCRVAVCRLKKDDWCLTPPQIEWRLHATRLKGTLWDLSMQGAAILLPEPLSVGESVMLRLFCPRRDRHVDQQATVVGIAEESGGCKLMCQFRKKLSLEQVSLFSRFLSESDWI